MAEQEEKGRHVRIVLRSERYEVEESLFSGEDGEEELTVREDTGAPEPEVLEIRAFGLMTEQDGRVEISYDESEATGLEGSHTSVSFLAAEQGIVSMNREGAVSTTLVFETGKRYRCVYQTPYMPFEICVRTLKVENALLQDGSLTLDYVIEIRGAKAERNKFYMQVL